MVGPVSGGLVLQHPLFRPLQMHTFSQQCVILKFVCFVIQNIAQNKQRGCWRKWFCIVWRRKKITQQKTSWGWTGPSSAPTGTGVYFDYGLLHYIDDYQLPLHKPVNLLAYLHAYLLTCMLTCFLTFLYTYLLTVNSNHPKSHTSYPLNFHRLYLVNFKFMIYLPR